MLNQLIETYKAIGKVPKIKDLCERHGLCARTVKLHKRHFELAGLLSGGQITQEEYAALKPKWEGVRPYKKSELSVSLKKGVKNGYITQYKKVNIVNT